MLQLSEPVGGLSINTVVLNSRGQQGKLWLPKFSHF